MEDVCPCVWAGRTSSALDVATGRGMRPYVPALLRAMAACPVWATETAEPHTPQFHTAVLRDVATTAARAGDVPLLRVLVTEHSARLFAGAPLGILRMDGESLLTAGDRAFVAAVGAGHVAAASYLHSAGCARTANVVCAACDAYCAQTTDSWSQAAADMAAVLCDAWRASGAAAIQVTDLRRTRCVLHAASPATWVALERLFEAGILVGGADLLAWLLSHLCVLASVPGVAELPFTYAAMWRLIRRGVRTLTADAVDAPLCAGWVLNVLALAGGPALFPEWPTVLDELDAAAGAPSPWPARALASLRPQAAVLLQPSGVFRGGYFVLTATAGGSHTFVCAGFRTGVMELHAFDDAVVARAAATAREISWLKRTALVALRAALRRDSHDD